MKYCLLLLPAVAVGALFAPVQKAVDAWREIVVSEDNVASPSYDAPTVLHAIGHVEPLSGTRHLSFEMGGVIEYTACDIGDVVEQGQVLMRLRDQTARAELLVAQQQLRLDEAHREQVLSGVHPLRLEIARHRHDALQLRADFLKRQLQRSERLVESAAVSRSEVDRDSVDLRVATEELSEAAAQLEYLEQHVTAEDSAVTLRRVELARAQVDLAETHLAKCVLRAPQNGHVLDILHREGESVDEITLPPVIVFGSLDRLRISAEVDEQYVRLLQPGARATVSGRNLQGRAFKGRITSIKPRMGKKTAFGEDPSERRSQHVAEVLIEMEENFAAPIDLFVDVAIELPPP